MLTRSLVRSARWCAIGALVLVGSLAWSRTPAGAAPPAGSSIGLFAWGDNSSGELGNGTLTNSSVPSLVSLPTGVHPTAVAGSGGLGDPPPSYFAGYAIGSDGNLYSWGDNTAGALGDGSLGGFSASPVVVALPSGVHATAIAAGQGLGYAIGSDGNLYSWGDSPYGALGTGSTQSATPAKVSFPSGVTPKAIAAGFETGYAIGSDGHLYAWGDNFYGELGTGGAATSSTPVVVPLPSGVTPVSIAGGGGTGYAIGSDGNLYAWGLNGSGQLGNGTTTSSTTPVVVSMPSGVTAKSVAGGGSFAYAIGSDGHEYAWGNDIAGQLGNGANASSSTPVVVALPTGVTPTSISGNYSCGYAIGSDGHLYAWGSNYLGEIGDGSNTNSSTPVVVSLPAGSTVQQLGPEAGSDSGYAIASTPNVAPTIATQPTSQTVTAGETVSFTAAAGGFPPPTVQWEISTDGGTTFTPVSGATSATLTLPPAALSQNGDQFKAVFTNVGGSATTAAATLTVHAPVAPTITTQPTDQNDAPGQIATFTAAASGDPTPSVVWQYSSDGGSTWSNIPGNSTSPTLSGVVLGSFENGWKFRAVFTNSGGSATTNPATLNLIAPVAPTISTQPTDQNDAPGQIATFAAAASGSPTPSVVWLYSSDGGSTWTPIPNVTSPTLSGVVLGTFENGWQFRAVFTNGGGSATTNSATLTVP